ncbi:helix-turn-helix transcriptional regulator [Rothia koreensis]|uniref:helix-turn-helix transcriptional regulator n=1 Tax=Rothia koreensis TaxID=592378 RepID=UPI0037C7982E
MCNRNTTTEIGALWMQLHDRQRLKRLMRMKGISARALAREAGWRSHTYLGRLLRGEVDTLETTPALRIAYALEVPVDDLFLTQMSRKNSDTSPKNGNTAKAAA